MTFKSYTLHFQGYWLESNVLMMPEIPGIFCVYASTYFEERNTLGINELVYIGEASNIRSSISTHEKLELWVNHVNRRKLGEDLCYSYAEMPNPYGISDRKRVRDVLVNKHNPLILDKTYPQFEFETEVKTYGENALLQNYMSVGG